MTNLNAIFKSPRQDLSPSQQYENITWKYVSSNRGVDVFVTKAPGSKLLAFRGIAKIDMHISDVLRPFANLTLSHQWVDMLRVIEAYSLDFSSTDPVSSEEDMLEYFSENRGDVVYQVLHLPWPISPRELVLRRNWLIDHQNKSVTFRYQSVSDPRIPESKERIRADVPFTIWKFSAVEKSGIDPDQCGHRSAATIVEIQCLVDSKGSIPSWFMNYVQRSWPSKTIEVFTKLARRELGRSKQDFPLVSQW